MILVGLKRTAITQVRWTSIATVTHLGLVPTTARAVGHLAIGEPVFRDIQLLGPQ